MTLAQPSPSQLAAEVIRALDLQQDLPQGQEPPVWHLQLALPPEILWAAVALAAAMLLYFFIRDVLPGMLPAPRGGWVEPGAAGEAGGAQAPEAAVAAEELARQGQFVEAMHWLLLNALAEIRRRLAEPIADSLTSREILRRVPLSETGRAALRDLIARVERSYFGEHPADAADYRSCRDSFERLNAALEGEAGG